MSDASYNITPFPLRHPDELREAMAQAKSLPELRTLAANYHRAVLAWAGPQAVWRRDSRSDDEPEQRSNRYQRHPLAVRFGPPPVDETSPDFTALRNSLKKHKLRHAIILYEGMVLCGWSRYRAGLEADVDLRFKECKGPPMDAIECIVSEDAMRRHMNYTQRVMQAAKMVTTTHGGDRKSTSARSEHLKSLSDSPDQTDICPLEITQAMAANWWNVTPKGVARALKTLREASDSPVAKEIETALGLGKNTFGQVAVLIEKPDEEQWETVQSDEWKYSKLRKPLAKEYQPQRKPFPPPQNRVGRIFEQITDRQARRNFIKDVILDRLDDDDRLWLDELQREWLKEYEEKYQA
jgi:hypothetical protein